MKEFEEHKEFRNPPSELFRDIACNVVDFYNLTQECCGSDRRMEYPKMNKRISNCCGAPVDYDSDICSNPLCGEHCDLLCPDCNGEGTIDVLDDSKSVEIRIDPPIKTITCKLCDGEGEIEA